MSNSARLDMEQAARYKSGDFTAPGYYHLLQCKRILMLQGPMGTFFNRVAKWLHSHRIEVYKINFNGGDWLFHRHLNATNFRGKPEEFQNFLQIYLEQHGIDGIVCFGDCRFYHQVGAELAAQIKIPFFAFEEGYIRPNYITLERGGVNMHSLLSRERKFYQSLPDVTVAQPQATFPSFARVAGASMLYYGIGRLLRKAFPHYEHHRVFSVRYEARNWFRSWYRKHLNRYRDRPVMKELIGQHENRYFAVALQVYNDFQIRQHSPYDDVRDFIREVVASFATHADKEHHLVFKHHPMDRGQRDYRRLLNKLSEQYDLAGRVHYVHDIHLPTLLRKARGVVTINSTVGLSALHHGKSLQLMGRALYDIEGLTHQDGLDKFWSIQHQVDDELWRRFKNFLITQTQLNGAFYGRDFQELIEPKHYQTPTKLARPLVFREHISNIART
jgi:capsular polysaccharide export protein